MYVLFILLIIPKFSIIEAHRDIIASITNITNNPCSSPYIIPPALSNCFIIGSSASSFDIALNIINISFVIINNPIATTTFILTVDTCSATMLTVAFCTSLV